MFDCARETLIVLGSYALGCFCTGYYLVRWLAADDIRRHASGSVGARNVGRLLGPRLFVVTLAGDVGKGAAAVGAAHYFRLERWWLASAMLAVVVGHVLPVQLRFRGGKGVATSLGGLLIFDYQVLIGVLLLFGVAALLFRRFTLTGLGAFALMPVVAAALGRPLWHVAGLLMLSVFVLLAHRANIAAALRARRGPGGGKEDDKAAAEGILQ